MTDRAAERFRAGFRFTTDAGTLVIASVRGTPESPIVRFDGIGDRTAAEDLNGRELRIPRAMARRPGEYLWADLVGLEVFTPEGTRLGAVTEVLRAGGADVLVVRDGARELLLPTIDTVVRQVDVEGGRIVVTPMEEA